MCLKGVWFHTCENVDICGQPLAELSAVFLRDCLLFITRRNSIFMWLYHVYVFIIQVCLFYNLLEL